MRSSQLFTKDEDSKLIYFVKKFGGDYRRIAQYIPGKTPNRLKDRYVNYLSSEIQSCDWPQEEDDKLIDVYYEEGPKWKRTSYFPAKSPNIIKNRFNAIQKSKKLRNVNHEDDTILGSQLNEALENDREIIALESCIPGCIQNLDQFNMNTTYNFKHSSIEDQTKNNDFQTMIQLFKRV